jgi:hypothetical protein
MLPHYLSFLREWGNRFSVSPSGVSLGTFFSGDRYARSILTWFAGPNVRPAGGARDPDFAVASSNM